MERMLNSEMGSSNKIYCWKAMLKDHLSLPWDRFMKSMINGLKRTLAFMRHGRASIREATAYPQDFFRHPCYKQKCMLDESTHVKECICSRARPHSWNEREMVIYSKPNGSSKESWRLMEIPRVPKLGCGFRMTREHWQRDGGN